MIFLKKFNKFNFLIYAFHENFIIALSHTLRPLRVPIKFYFLLFPKVDMPKQGFGNSNDGNTARKFFENPIITSKILNISEALLTDFAFLLKEISKFDEEIDLNSFKAAAERINEHFKQPEFTTISPTVHILLCHGPAIIERYNLMIGIYTEESGERTNKNVRSARLHHAKKVSRTETMIDMVHWLLEQSDPMVILTGEKIFD